MACYHHFSPAFGGAASRFRLVPRLDVPYGSRCLHSKALLLPPLTSGTRLVESIAAASSRAPLQLTLRFDGGSSTNTTKARGCLGAGSALLIKPAVLSMASGPLDGQQSLAAHASVPAPALWPTPAWLACVTLAGGRLHEATNNTAEYIGLLEGLRAALALLRGHRREEQVAAAARVGSSSNSSSGGSGGLATPPSPPPSPPPPWHGLIRGIHIEGDSKLVLYQALAAPTGRPFGASKPHLRLLKLLCRVLVRELEGECGPGVRATPHWVPRADNLLCDAAAGAAIAYAKALSPGNTTASNSALLEAYAQACETAGAVAAAGEAARASISSRAKGHWVSPRVDQREADTAFWKRVDSIAAGSGSSGSSRKGRGSRISSDEARRVLARQPGGAYFTAGSVGSQPRQGQQGGGSGSSSSNSSSPVLSPPYLPSPRCYITRLDPYLQAGQVLESAIPGGMGVDEWAAEDALAAQGQGQAEALDRQAVEEALAILGLVEEGEEGAGLAIGQADEASGVQAGPATVPTPPTTALPQPVAVSVAATRSTSLRTTSSQDSTADDHPLWPLGQALAALTKVALRAPSTAAAAGTTASGMDSSTRRVEAVLMLRPWARKLGAGQAGLQLGYSAALVTEGQGADSGGSAATGEGSAQPLPLLHPAAGAVMEANADFTVAVTVPGDSSTSARHQQQAAGVTQAVLDALPGLAAVARNCREQQQGQARTRGVSGVTSSWSSSSRAAPAAAAARPHPDEPAYLALLMSLQEARRQVERAQHSGQGQGQGEREVVGSSGDGSAPPAASASAEPGSTAAPLPLYLRLRVALPSPSIYEALAQALQQSHGSTAGQGRGDAGGFPSSSSSSADPPIQQGHSQAAVYVLRDAVLQEARRVVLGLHQLPAVKQGWGGRRQEMPLTEVVTVEEGGHLAGASGSTSPSLAAAAAEEGGMRPPLLRDVFFVEEESKEKGKRARMTAAR